MARPQSSQPTTIVPGVAIERRLLMLRGERVILDRDLADLYAVSTKALNQAVRRNIERFPPDFAFLLTAQEVAILRSQTVTSSWRTPRR